MTETHGRVKTRDGHTGPAGTHRPGGARLCVTRPHRVTAGPASQGATAWQARQPGRGESQIPVTTPAADGGEAERGKRPGQRCLVLTLLAVILVDQAAKWWAWRHLTGVTINPGGDFLTGPTIGSWYANPLAGALLDLVDFGLVGTAAAILARRRHLAVTVCGSLMVGGWASNLLDRLGMHYWTAPGSVRGAVDFISAGGRSWNLADFFIIGATPLFLLATTQLARRAAGRPPPAQAGPARRNSLRARVPAVGVAGAALMMTVALGATHHGSLTKPSHTSTRKPPACAPDSRAAAAVRHLGPPCRRGPFRTAVRR